MKTIIATVLIVLTALLGYLLLWPVTLEPQAWTPPPAPSAKDGVFALNEQLKPMQRLAENFGSGPEAVKFDAQGRMVTGYLDGRVVRFAADGTQAEVLANTGGRPLGIAFDDQGHVIVADARKGLLRILDGKVEVLTDQADGQRINFVDDVTADRSGRVFYFSDASSKYALGTEMGEAFEHGANGRLIRYNLDTQKTEVLLEDLHFANGVTLGPDDAFVLINETTEYRVTRYWLKGDKARTHDTFAENLPGYPDNITFNGRDRYWVALYAPRILLLDFALPPGREWIRKAIFRLPRFVQPAPAMHGHVLGLDLQGNVIASLQDATPGAYAPITSVIEHNGSLTFGSLSYPAIGRLPLSLAIPQ